MKKSSTVLIIIFLVFFVFIFENLRSLMLQLESSEYESVKSLYKIEARYLTGKYNGDIDAIKGAKRFDRVFPASKLLPEGEGDDRDGKKIFFFYIKSGSGKIFRFEKMVISPALLTIRKIRGIVSALTLLLGILIVISGIYLVVISRRKKEEKREHDVPMLQDYLIKLEDSKTRLKETVNKQKIDVVRSDEINRTIINNIGAAIVFVNENGKIDIFNVFAEKIFNKNFVLAKNSDAESVFKDFPEIYDLIKSTEKRSIVSEVNAGGKTFLIEVTPIKTGGKIIIARDISERKQRELLKNHRKNFETLGEMTLFLTHEIRNSLGVIYGYTKTFDPGNIKTEKVNREIEFLTRMMESFLNFSKPVALKKRSKIDLPDLLSDISRDYNIKVDIDVNSGDKFITSDRDIVFSVFSNLAKNSKESGADRLSVKIEKNKNNELNIIFSDNGKGIGKDIRDKIWLPFFTSRDKGTGMGLAIVKKMVYSLNGEISLLKTGKEGTSFSISLFPGD